MATRKKSQPDLTKVAPLPHDQENRVAKKTPIDQTVSDVLDKTTKGMPSDKKPGTEVMSYKDRMAALVQTTKKAEAPAGGYISTKGSRLAIGETRLPNDTIRAIVIEYRKDNEFYPVAYEAMPKGEFAAPSCSAIVRPHEILTPWRRPREADKEAVAAGKLKYDATTDLVSDSDDPQVRAGAGCDSCQMLEFGSAKFIKGKTRTKGKACRESRRIHLFAADQCTTPEDALRAPFMTLIPPPTSLDNFKRFANECTTVLDLPVFGVIVDITLVPDDSYMFTIQYKIVAAIKDEGILNALLTRHEQLSEKIITPPKQADDDDSKATRTGPGKGKF